MKEFPNILLVEEDEERRNEIKQLLLDEGLKVKAIPCRHGVEKQMLHEENIDVIMADVSNPNINITALRMSEKYKDDYAIVFIDRRTGVHKDKNFEARASEHVDAYIDEKSAQNDIYKATLTAMKRKLLIKAS